MKPNPLRYGPYWYVCVKDGEVHCNFASPGPSFIMGDNGSFELRKNCPDGHNCADPSKIVIYGRDLMEFQARAMVAELETVVGVLGS